MSRSCSNGRRCRARGLNIILTDDNFRKGPNPPQADQYYFLCNHCRPGGRHAVIPARRLRESEGILSIVFYLYIMN
jgi:hypothetical protein